ncbi:MAG: hypothetical protein A2X45_10690 [Lentisphaerae bacterium GWF2_50_93]|nr:MAG: hypothetical protein A2X45_10690 [Lentisphaerae bacterium GWF2_50_93]
MTQQTMIEIGQAGAFMSVFFASIGSTLGTGIAGAAAVGAWKKCYSQEKPAPFQLAIFAGTPLSQIIYALIMMILINKKVLEVGGFQNWHFCLAVGILCGIGLGVNAWFMGIAAAKCCDSFADTNKGFTNNLMVIGIMETVALFVMVFAIILLNTVKVPGIVEAVVK